MFCMRYLWRFRNKFQITRRMHLWLSRTFETSPNYSTIMVKWTQSKINLVISNYRKYQHGRSLITGERCQMTSPSLPPVFPSLGRSWGCWWSPGLSSEPNSAPSTVCLLQSIWGPDGGCWGEHWGLEWLTSGDLRLCEVGVFQRLKWKSSIKVERIISIYSLDLIFYFRSQR